MIGIPAAQDVIVEGRGGPIPARVYTRPDVHPGGPAILFIHDGGFVEGVDSRARNRWRIANV